VFEEVVDIANNTREMEESIKSGISWIYGMLDQRGPALITRFFTHRTATLIVRYRTPIAFPFTVPRIANIPRFRQQPPGCAHHTSTHCKNCPNCKEPH
jgi:hypothetical protein